ncbi:MAG: hypothetical protein GXP34_04615 [Actinobacteria bacterium]|nr:hypothetical protein [Actinomycetota bacterium]
MTRNDIDAAGTFSLGGDGYPIALGDEGERLVDNGTDAMWTLQSTRLKGPRRPPVSSGW